MEKIFKKDLEEKIRNPKRYKIITIKTSHIKIEENFNDIFTEIEEVIDNNSNIFSSYDISQSVDDITMTPMFHIVFYP